MKYYTRARAWLHRNLVRLAIVVLLIVHGALLIWTGPWTCHGTRFPAHRNARENPTNDDILPRAQENVEQKVEQFGGHLR